MNFIGGSVAGRSSGSVGGMSSVGKPPPLSVYLNASTSAPKKAQSGSHRVVQCILHDLNRIKRGKAQRRLQKCERLIYYIVQQLRARRDRSGGEESEDHVGAVLFGELGQPTNRNGQSEKVEQYQHDHLLETTTIWALIHMLRMDSQYMKEVMLGAGVPGVLYEIMSSHSLTGATRQYASELCFFLCSNAPMPDSRHLTQMGPMLLNQLPEVHHADRLVGGDDSISLAASELSSLADDKGTLPFVPYRINRDNMAKLDSLFDNMSQDGYGNIADAHKLSFQQQQQSPKNGRGLRTTSTPNKKRAELHATAEMSESMFSSRHGFGKTDHLEELDDQSISSSISSNSQSHEFGDGMYSIGNRFSGLVDSQSMRRNVPWQSQSTLDDTLAAASLVRGGDSMSIASATLNSQQQERHQKMSRKLFHMSATPQIMPMPSKSGRTARSSNRGFLEKIISQSNAHFAIDSRLRGSGGGGNFPSTSGRLSPDGESASVLYDNGDAESIDGVPLASSLRTVNTAPSSTLHSPREGMRPIRLASLDPSADMLPANRLTTRSAGGLQGALFSAAATASPPPPRSKKERGTNLHGNTPSLDGMDRTAASRAGAPMLNLASGGVAASRSRLSVDSASEPSDVPSFLAQLDPLSVNVSRGLQAHIIDAPSSVLEVNEDDVTVYSRSSDDDSEDEDEGRDHFDEGSRRQGGLYGDEPTSPSYYNTPLGKIERKKDLKRKQKLRVRAEKLIDHKFIKQLFNKKARVEDTWSTVKRLEDVLELVDSDRSGFVTWEYFARALLAVAPQHLLRSDVMAFMQAQNDDDQALIDYREFVVTGKVIVVQRQNGRSILPINGWLERQRLYTGDATTYTWKNHLEWYNSRQSQALIWLMRRANRAFAKSDLYVKMRRELAHIGARAKAFEYLRGISAQADEANAGREDAKRFILGRVLHARLRMLRVDEAQRYLSALAHKVVEMTALKEAIAETLRAEEVFQEKRVQVGIDRVYWIRFRNLSCREKLKWYGDRSIRHTVRKEQDFAWLVKFAKTVEAQIMFREAAQDWLLRIAERYHAYCQVQDQMLLSLLRIGGKALAYLNRQIDANAWLHERGEAAAMHVDRQSDTRLGLCSQGQRTLHFLNERENAFAYCYRRRMQADILIENQKNAIRYFRSLVAKVRATEAALDEAQAYLAEKGHNALIFVNRRNAAQRHLAHVAKRAHVVRRRVVNTFIDLQQIGQFARIANFNRYWMGIRDNVVRVNEEVQRLRAFDQKVGRARESEGLSLHERWRVELEDAFNTLSANLLLPGESVNDKKSAALEELRTPLLTKIGFVRLVNHGSLLELLPGEVEEAWRHLDPRATGYTTFDNLWRNWFEGRAVEQHRKFIEGKSKKKKTEGFTLVLADVLSPLDRVLFIYKKRFTVAEAKAARRGAEGLDDDDDEDDDDEDGGGDGDEDDEDEDDDEDEEDGDGGAATGYVTDGKTPQELEYDRLFMRMLGGDEGPMEANPNEKSYEDEVAARLSDKEAEVLEEQRRKLEAEEREAEARTKELEALALLKGQLGLTGSG